MLRLDGKAVVQARQTLLTEQIADFKAAAGRAPGLAVVLVGGDPASEVYVRNKRQTCEKLGIQSFEFDRPGDTKQDELLKLIKQLNADDAVDGILVQFPLPKGLSRDDVLNTIDPQKDPDGLTYENLGLLWAGSRRVAPCTPWGVMAMLEHYGLDVMGKRAVVIGRSNIVGKPMALLLSEAGATVTTCHSKTLDLYAHTREAEIVVVAAGLPRFIGRDAFRKDAVVIDVGIHRPDGAKLCGDVKYEELEGWVKAASPVPGGVGPLTIQMLMENTLRLAQLRFERSAKI